MKTLKLLVNPAFWKQYSIQRNEYLVFCFSELTSNVITSYLQLGAVFDFLFLVTGRVVATIVSVPFSHATVFAHVYNEFTVLNL
jgi:hypothetical protein